LWFIWGSNKGRGQQGWLWTQRVVRRGAMQILNGVGRQPTDCLLPESLAFPSPPSKATQERSQDT